GTITAHQGQLVGSGKNAYYPIDIQGVSYDDVDGSKKWISDFGPFTGARMEKIVAPPPEIDTVAMEFAPATSRRMRITVVLDSSYNQLPGTHDSDPITL